MLFLVSFVDPYPRRHLNVHSTKAMSLPVLPPTLPSAFLALEAAFEMAGPAELVTRDRPSEAFETFADAVSFAFAAVSLAVEACLNCPLKSCRDWRKATLEAILAGMIATAAGKLMTE